MTQPLTLWVTDGQGSRVWDVDSNEYVDLHGRDVMVLGHAHPAVVAAVRERIGRSSFFAQPTTEAVEVAEALTDRFRMPLWRFSNSGTEATMDAVHLMRAYTGRSVIIKLEGAYHGHHDSVMVAIDGEVQETGIPGAMSGLTRIVSFNDLGALERVLFECRGSVAGMIIEPVMLNAGVILPQRQYLADLVDMCHAEGALVTFDEVKSGFTLGLGGASGTFSVSPDLICLGKALGAGLPSGAVGGSEAIMGMVATGRYQQVGTFNGNPLTMAAAQVTCKTLGIDAYEHLGRLRDEMVRGIGAVMSRYQLPGQVVAIGAKGSMTLSALEIRNFADFLSADPLASHCHWLVQANRGVLLPPGAKSWLLSVQHTSADVQRLVANFEEFATEAWA